MGISQPAQVREDRTASVGIVENLLLFEHLDMATGPKPGGAQRFPRRKHGMDDWARSMRFPTGSFSGNPSAMTSQLTCHPFKVLAPGEERNWRMLGRFTDHDSPVIHKMHQVMDREWYKFTERQTMNQREKHHNPTPTQRWQ